MKTVLFLALVSVIAQSTAARAEELSTREVVGIGMATCATGGAIGAAAGAIFTNGSQSGAIKGAVSGCVLLGTFGTGMAIAHADENAPSEAQLQHDDSEE